MSRAYPICVFVQPHNIEYHTTESDSHDPTECSSIEVLPPVESTGPLEGTHPETCLSGSNSGQMRALERSISPRGGRVGPEPSAPRAAGRHLGSSALGTRRVSLDLAARDLDTPPARELRRSGEEKKEEEEAERPFIMDPPEAVKMVRSLSWWFVVVWT